jgi:hypothetical protein
MPFSKTDRSTKLTATAGQSWRWYDSCGAAVFWQFFLNIAAIPGMRSSLVRSHSDYETPSHLALYASDLFKTEIAPSFIFDP